MSYIGIVFFTLSALAAIANLCMAIETWLRRRSGINTRYSLVPFASLAFGFLAWFKARGTFGLGAFVPAMLDPGTWAIIPLWFKYWARRSAHRHRFRRMKKPPPKEFD
jgi:hypothetical protein